MTINRLFFILSCAGLSNFGAAHAQTSQQSAITAPAMPVPETPVVEIFVSRNCVACPKALKNLRELEGDGSDFLQLTWSVDYWDYLGEADALAIDASSVRQRQYAERMALRGPYTPQAVFNGDDQTSGARKNAVKRRLIHLEREIATPLIRMSVTDGNLRIEGPVMPRSDVYLLAVSSLEAPGGQWLENAVLSAETIGDWSGGFLEQGVTCADRCIALVQAENFGPIYGAVEFEGAQTALPNH